MLVVPVITSAQNTSNHSDLFGYSCQSNSILFTYQNTTVFHMLFDKIQPALYTATSQQKNQLIAATNTVGLWALKSNELQIHIHTNPDTTKTILPGNTCQQAAENPSSVVYGQAFAIVHVTGVGRAFAFAEVTATGEARAFAQGTGEGAALAFAQSTHIGSTPSGRVYVVQQGDNLFRIALNHGTTLEILVALNNIEDPTAILVGQEILLP